MKRSWYVMLVLVLFASLALAPSLATAAQGDKPITLVLAHSATPNNSLAIAYSKFAELVAKKSNGKLRIDVIGGGALAGDQTAVDGVRMGTLDMGSSASNNMASYTKAFWFADLPYIFKSIESSHKVWWGPIGEELKEMASRNIKAKVLFFIDTGGGFRMITNNKREVKSPDDLKGIRIGIPGSPIMFALVKAWGGSSTPMPWPEMYTALEQKVIDGEHLHAMWIYQAKHFEALKYMTEVNALSNVHVALMSNKAWGSLTPELQKVVMEAGKETQTFGAKVDAEVGKESMKKLLEAGLKLYVPSPDEAKKWRDVAPSIWSQFEDKVSQDLINRVLKAQE